MSDEAALAGCARTHSLSTPWGWGALACCALFVAQGLAVLPYPGIQNDEALFGSAIYPPRLEVGAVQIAGHSVPVMLMTYLGTVKSLLYLPILKVFGPSVCTIRLPMVLAGAGTVWLFFLLLARVANPAIALLGAALLATDPSFVLCTTFDWGPVALQILLFTASVLLVVRYFQRTSGWALAIAGLLAGIALWNKAIFVWSLAAFALALVTVFRRRVLYSLNLKVALLASAGFLAGALPLIVYNASSGGATLVTNTHVALTQSASKLRVLRGTLDGSALFGYLVNAQPPRPVNAKAAAMDVATRVASALRYPRHTLFPIALAAAVVLLPFLWRSPLRDPTLVALLYGVFQYLQMFLTVGAGTGSHHVVLLDPAPQAFVALALGAAAGRVRALGARLLVAAGSLLSLSNLAVATTYLALFSTVGSPTIWTNAIGPLTSALTRLAPRQVVVMDWGLLASLRLLSAGRLPLVMGSDGFTTDPVDKEAENRAADWFTAKGCYFVSHVRGKEIFSGVRQRLDAVAASHELYPRTEAVVDDSNGRHVFEIFRYASTGGQHPRETGTSSSAAAAGGPDNDRPSVQRGVFYYQPKAAHWWFWDAFDLKMYAKDLRAFSAANLDTVTLDIQVKDFVDGGGRALRLKAANTAKLVAAIREAERHGLRVMLILWYTNGYPDPADSGGARLIVPEEYRRYLEMTRQLASATRGHAVTFFFTNELFDLRAGYDPSKKTWRLRSFPPASASFASWARATDSDLSRWNRDWGTSFAAWDKVDVAAVFPRREYWDWLSSVIRSRLPDLVAAIKNENPLAKVGYEDYTFVYGWGDSAIPRPCPLDYIGFGIYRDMLTSNADLADEAYRKLTGAYPGVPVFVPEVGMDTHRYTEAEQAEWFSSVAKWARRRKVSLNILMWRDYTPTPLLPSLDQSHYGLRRLDDSPKPAFRALGLIPRE